MNDPRDLQPGPAGDGELVSAYLDGDLGAGEAAAFEARLAAEPELAAQLERTREVVERLAGLRATPPPGYAERLRERLAAEGETTALDTVRRGAPAAPGTARAAAAATAGPGGARPAHSRPGRTRAERGRARRTWTPLAAAAGILALALVGGVALLNSVGGPDGVARLAGTADEPAHESLDDAEERVELFADDADIADPADDAGDDEVADEPDEDGELEPMMAGQPALVDAGTELGDADEAREHLARSAAPAGVLDMGLDPAADVASAYRVAIQRAEPFASAVRPDQCLDDVLAGARGPAVPVEVEAVTLEDSEALAYLVVTASEGSDRLDRVEGWVVEADGCATRIFSDVTPGR